MAVQSSIRVAPRAMAATPGNSQRGGVSRSCIQISASPAAAAEAHAPARPNKAMDLCCSIVADDACAIGPMLPSADLPERNTPPGQYAGKNAPDKPRPHHVAIALNNSKEKQCKRKGHKKNRNVACDVMKIDWVHRGAF